MSDYPRWSNQPHTDKRAGPARYRQCEGIRAIRVQAGTYRGCLPINGLFEVVTDPRVVRGKLRVEVRCSWHGAKPLTCFPNLVVEPNQYELFERFHGEVIDDIGTPRAPGP